jgi:predicted transcriptional regulator
MAGIGAFAIDRRSALAYIREIETVSGLADGGFVGSGKIEEWPCLRERGASLAMRLLMSGEGWLA